MCEKDITFLIVLYPEQNLNMQKQPNFGKGVSFSSALCFIIQIQSEEIFSPSKHPSVVQPQHLQCHKLPLPHCGWSRRNRRGCRDCRWGWPWCTNYCCYFGNIFAPIQMDSITANSNTNFTCAPHRAAQSRNPPPQFPPPWHALLIS